MSVFSNYQSEVNNQTGALGPTTSAFGDFKSTEPPVEPWNLNAQPLEIGANGAYYTATDVNASNTLPVYESVSATETSTTSFGRRNKRSKKYRKKQRKTRKSKQRKTRKSKQRKSKSRTKKYRKYRKSYNSKSKSRK